MNTWCRSGVADSAGAGVAQTFTVQVSLSAAPPQITSTPPTTGTVGQLYLYQVGVTAGITSIMPTGGLIYSLDTAPAGMTIDSSSGAVRWTPSDFGSFPVTVRVTDILGQGMYQSYNINVSLTVPLLPPVITTQPATGATFSVPYTQQITARDPQGQTLSYALANWPAGMTIDPQSGLIQYTPAGTGAVTVTVVATDTSGLR